MKNLEKNNYQVEELTLKDIKEIEGGAIPMWLKVVLTIGGAGAAGYAVGRYVV